MSATAKVEPCEDCGSMKPRGARLHAPLLHGADVSNPEHPRCKHGRPYLRTCRRVMPPECCWADYKPSPSGATPRAAAEQRLQAFLAGHKAGGR